MTRISPRSPQKPGLCFITAEPGDTTALCAQKQMSSDKLLRTKKHLHNYPLTSLVLSSSLCSACLEISTSMIFCRSSSFSSSARLRLSSTLSSSLCKRTDTSLATWDHSDRANTLTTGDTKWAHEYFIICAFNVHNTPYTYTLSFKLLSHLTASGQGLWI